MSGMARYTFACWSDVRPVFMRHHKYACCFVLYRGIYDSEVTVFALSEVIYLSSTVTAGMNEAEDTYTSRRPDSMILKALIGGGRTEFTNLIFELNILSIFLQVTFS